MKKQTKIIIALAAVLCVLVAAALILPSMFSADTAAGEKTITFTVIYEDGTEKVHEITTDAEYLGEAVHEKGLVTDEEYENGYYSFIDGTRADYNADGAFWSISKGDEWLTVGMNEQVIKDGESYSATYTAAE